MSQSDIEQTPAGMLRLLLGRKKEEARALLEPVEDPSQGARGKARVGQPADSWLHTCARQGDYHLTLKAARRSSDVNRPETGVGETPLLTALGHCNLEGALALLDAGADHKARDRDGLGVLHHAVFSGDAAIMNLAFALAPEQLNEKAIGREDLLIALGQAPEEEDPDYDWEPRGGNRSHWSRQERASPPRRDELFENEGLAPIHCAIVGSSAEALEFLLASGADPSVVDRDGKSALALAASLGDASSITLLLSAGVDPNELDKAGRSALSWAVRSGKAPAVQALLEAGADLDARGPAAPGLWEVVKRSGREAAAETKSEAIRALVESHSLSKAIQPAASAPSRVARGL